MQWLIKADHLALISTTNHQTNLPHSNTECHLPWAEVTNQDQNFKSNHNKCTSNLKKLHNSNNHHSNSMHHLLDKEWDLEDLLLEGLDHRLEDHQVLINKWVTCHQVAELKHHQWVWEVQDQWEDRSDNRHHPNSSSKIIWWLEVAVALMHQVKKL